MSATRLVIEKSFAAALRNVPADGTLAENGATLAGHYLQIAGGNVERAIALTTHVDTSNSITARKLFDTARSHLAKVLEEERSERGPRLQTG